jgi:hypothetical protein
MIVISGCEEVNALNYGKDRQMGTTYSPRLIILSVLVVAGCSKNASPPLAGSYEVSLGLVTCEEIHGWAWDNSRPDEAISVEVYIDDVSLGPVVAGRYREDLEKAGKGNGKHSFVLPFPEKLKDGKDHAVQVGISGKDMRSKVKQIRCTGDGK